MFIINIFLRFALIALCLVLGTTFWFLNDFGFWYALPFLLIGIVLLVGYFLMGTIPSTGQLLQSGDMTAAKQRLKLTFFPKMLFPANRGFYHVILGTIAANEKDLKTAEEQFLIAEGMQYPTDNEKASVLLNLAGIYAQKQRWNQVQLYVKKIENLKVTQKMILDQLEQIKLALKNKGALSMKNQQMARKSGAKFYQKR